MSEDDLRSFFAKPFHLEHGPLMNARLVAYVVGARHPGSTDALRVQARKALPAHMVPEQFVFLERLPLKPNG